MIGPLRLSLSVVLCLSLASHARAASADPAPVRTPSPKPTASEPPAVVALRAKIDAARGERPARERVVRKVVEFGRTLTRTTVRDGDDVRSTRGDGPLSTSSGTFEGQDWHQNANGLTVLDQPREGAEANERYVSSVRHVTKPIVANVIEERDAKGDGTSTFVDPTTSRVVRVEEKTRTETTVTTYDDFRTTSGYTVAWHEHATSGDAADDEDERIVSISTAGITPADAAIAQPRRELVSFPKGVAQVALPVMLDSDHKFVVHVTIGARGADFVLDTGASGIVIDSDFARSLGLAPIDEGTNAENSGRYNEGAAVIPQMDVGALKMRDVVVGTTASLAFANHDAPVRIVGLLGFDFIASLALKLDYEHATVTAIDYDAFVAPARGQAIEVPIRLGTQQPETDVAVDGQVGESFLLDTGGIGGVLLTDLFTRRHAGVTHGFLGGVPMRISGVGGDTTATEYEVPRIRVGSATFSNFAAVVMDSDQAYGSFDGVVGPDILQLFTVTTDYADSMVYLQKNALGRQSAAAAR